LGSPFGPRSRWRCAPGNAIIHVADLMLAKAESRLRRIGSVGERYPYAQGSFKGGRHRPQEFRCSDAAKRAKEFRRRISTPKTSSRRRLTFPNGCHIAESRDRSRHGKLDIVTYTAVGRLRNMLDKPHCPRAKVQRLDRHGLGQALTEERGL